MRLGAAKGRHVGSIDAGAELQQALVAVGEGERQILEPVEVVVRDRRRPPVSMYVAAFDAVQACGERALPVRA